MKTRTHLLSGRAAVAGVFSTSLLGLFLVSGGDSRAQTVNFPDPNLEAIVRETIPKPDGDISEADMLSLDHLYGSDRNISDTTGLEYARNLTDLELTRNPVTNFSGFTGLTNLQILTWIWSPLNDLTFVTNLVNLRRAVIYGNQFEDISPVLSLTKLELLQLDWNPAITNLTIVSAMTNLTHLSLAGDGVTNVAFVSSLTGLQGLSLYINGVNDVTPLLALTNLTSLGLGQNGLINAGPVGLLTGLEELWLNGNNLTNVSFLAGLTNLTRLALDYTWLVDMSPVTNMTKLTELNVGENSLTTLPDLSSLTALAVFMMAGNQIADLSPLTNLTALNNLHLQRNPFADLSPLTQCPLITSLLLHDNSAVTNLPVIAALTNLHWLQIQKMLIDDLNLLAPLANLPELWELDLYENRISDLSPLTNYPALHRLLVEVNRLQRIEPLLDMPGLNYVNLCRNVLDTSGGAAAWSVITNLQERGVTVDYDPQWPLPVPIEFVSQPANRSAFVSNYVAFTASVVGGTPGPSYRWQKDGIDLVDDSRISGTDTDTLQINEVSPDDSGFYRVRVWDEWITTNSPAAELKVITNVAFADPNLEQAVRAQLSIYERPLTPDDLVGMTYLYASHTYWEITNLGGLEAAADLEELDLEGQIALQGFAPLTFLSQFHILRLSGCGLDNLDFIADLPPLTGLELGGNFIEDLSPLDQQPGLQYLWLEENQLTQINPLLDLASLAEVYLWSNRLDTNETSTAWNVITNLQERGVYVEYDPQYPAPDRPVITLQPANLAAYPGDDISLHVEATGSGSGLNFRWLKNGINLTDAGNVYGTESDTLWIDDVQPGDGGNYRVRIWDENGMTNSRTVTLRVVTNVSFVDPQLELAVRDRLNIPTAPLTLTDIATMDWLDAANYSITNISGIESAINLNWLSLRSNREITDFTPLTALWRLSYLELNDCEVSDIAFVADLPPLAELHLWRGNITDISPLLAQPQLLRLNLAYHTGITNVEVLTTLTSLEGLSFEGTLVSNISFAAFMPNLRDLSIEGDGVSDLSPLTTATNLLWLDIGNNQITNGTPLTGCTNLYWLSAGNNQITSADFITNFTALTWLALDRNAFADVSPLAEMTNLIRVDVSWNPITNLATLVTLTRLNDLGIAGLGLSNLTFLGSLTSLTNALTASDNALTGLPSYPQLKQLRYLDLQHNPLANLNFVVGMTNLQFFYINDDGVANLSPLTGLTNLHSLGVAGNGITDISALATLPHLEWLTLWDNHLQDISPLNGLTNLGYVDLRYNWLNITPGSAAMTVIATLQARGTTADYDPQNEAPATIILSAPTWLGGNQFRFTITSAPGAVLQIWSSTNLAVWASAGFVTNDTGTTSFTHTADTTTRSFYRAQQQ